MGVRLTVSSFHVDNCGSGALSGYAGGPLRAATTQRIDPVAGTVTSGIPVGPLVMRNFTDES